LLNASRPFLEGCVFETMKVVKEIKITRHEVVKMKNRYKGYVFSPIDKNNGKLLIECPVAHCKVYPEAYETGIRELKPAKRES